MSDLIQFCKSLDIEVKMAKQPFDLKRALEQLNPDTYQDTLLIIDFSLDGVVDLQSIGHPEIKSPHGLDAGLCFVEHFLRPAAEPKEGEVSYSNIPIVMFTNTGSDEGDVKPRVEAINRRAAERRHPRVELVYKAGEGTPIGDNGRQQFRSVIESWIKGEWSKEDSSA
ncbi:MAG: hypothetical protein AB1646_22415 [Thermodesulfobacteriota bacterium]